MTLMMIQHLAVPVFDSRENISNLNLMSVPTSYSNCTRELLCHLHIKTKYMGVPIYCGIVYSKPALCKHLKCEIINHIM